MPNPCGKTQVVIIGAGPTGLSLAIQLMRYNIDFVIFEKNENTTPLSKAIVIQARSMEIFQEIGLAEKAMQQGRITTALNLFYHGKQRTALNFAGLGKGLSQFPFALSLEQSKTEKILVDYLAEHGKPIFWKTEFTHFEQDSNEAKVYYKNSVGKENIMETSYLVGCDGAKSLVRHGMGLTLEGDTLPKIFYVTDVRLNSPIICKDELYIFLIRKGFVLFFPMEGKGHYRVIGILPDKTEEDEQFTFEEIESSVKEQIMAPVEFEEVRWFSTYKVHSRKAKSFHNGRCFIAGDAAHIHTPAGGQGMNTGIQDAYNLAWKLALTIRKEVNNSVLPSYDAERHENAEHLLKTTDSMFDIMSGVNRFWNFIRLHIIPHVARFVTKNTVLNKRIFPILSQIGIAYPNSPLTIKSSVGRVKAGSLMPYFELQGDGKIFDMLTAPAFKILFFGNPGNNQIKEGDYAQGIVMHSIPDIPTRIFGSATDFYILLRPDNHISYIGKDANCCKTFLDEIAFKK